MKTYTRLITVAVRVILSHRIYTKQLRRYRALVCREATRELVNGRRHLWFAADRSRGLLTWSSGRRVQYGVTSGRVSSRSMSTIDDGAIASGVMVRSARSRNVDSITALFLLPPIQVTQWLVLSHTISCIPRFLFLMPVVVNLHVQLMRRRVETNSSRFFLRQNV